MFKFHEELNTISGILLRAHIVSITGDDCSVVAATTIDKTCRFSDVLILKNKICSHFFLKKLDN
jgi:hypothetical protein